MVPEHPEIERVLNGDPIRVQPQRVGHYLLAADQEDGFGATFNFYCTASGSWESEMSLYERHLGSDQAVRESWEHVLSAGTDGEAWDWDRLRATATWADRALLVVGITGREDQAEDGQAVFVRAVCGFAAPDVTRLLCDAGDVRREVAINEPWRSFVAVGVTARGTMSVVAYDVSGAVLEHRIFDA